MAMTYRRLGRSGLKVSTLSFGSWVSFGTQMGLDTALACMDAAQQAGVNFWDNAEAYAGGQSEQIMGDAIRELGWKRHEYVISTKLFWGIHGGVNMSNTLNRKYLMQAIDGSLERLGLEPFGGAHQNRAGRQMRRDLTHHRAQPMRRHRDDQVPGARERVVERGLDRERRRKREIRKIGGVGAAGAAEVLPDLPQAIPFP